MGDRSWHEAWVLKEDFVKYARILKGKEPDDTEENEDLASILTEIMGDEVEEEEKYVHVLITDLNGGGYDYFEEAAKAKLHFVGQTGSCAGAYTGINVWSDGSGKLEEWTADADGAGLVLHFSFGPEPLVPHYRSQLRVLENTVVWQEGLLSEIQEFLVGMEKVRELLGL